MRPDVLCGVKRQIQDSGDGKDDEGRQGDRADRPRIRFGDSESIGYRCGIQCRIHSAGRRKDGTPR